MFVGKVHTVREMQDLFLNILPRCLLYDFREEKTNTAEKFQANFTAAVPVNRVIKYVHIVTSSKA